MRDVTRYILIVFILITSIQIIAKERATKFSKFGKVDKHILEMQTYAPVPGASAVILFDKMYVDIQKRVSIFKRHRRTKILTEAGKEEANLRLGGFYSKSLKIVNLKAQVLLPNGNKIKVKKSEFFEEKIGDFIYKVFAIPGVEVGAVIEYEYEVESKYTAELPIWYFQNDVYTQASQYSVSIPPGYSFRVFFYNVDDIAPIQEDQVDVKRDIVKYTWETFDQLAIKKMPFMRTKEDYQAQMRFQLISYKSAWQYEEHIKDWSSVDNIMSENYKDMLEDDEALRNLAESKTKEFTSPSDKTQALYNYITRDIETEKRGYFYRRDKVRASTILSSKKATGVDKNLLLVNLLRSVGLEANPVIISTREYRRAIDNNPDIDQFNYTLAAVKIATKWLYMDTRAPLCPYKLLPENSLVGEGFLVNSIGGEFVTIPAPRNLNMQHCESAVSLDEYGGFHATSTIRFEHYAALNARQKLAENSAESFATELLEEAFGAITLDSVLVEGLDTYDTPLVLTLRYRAEYFAQAAGDKLYLRAPAISPLSRNPLESKTRDIPVEFIYNNTVNEVMTITLPDNFLPDELPKMAKVGQKRLRYLNLWKQEGNTITVERQFMRRAVYFAPSRYADLRGFYDYAVQFDQRQIVLAKPGE